MEPWKGKKLQDRVELLDFVFGGLMIYSFISNSATAVFRVARGCRSVLLLSAVCGVVSVLGRSLVAADTDLPSGEVIVLVSQVLLAAMACLGPR
jgi:ABC-type Mn2+/Zn2+ transport system permease subunit